ncbi:MAG: hypothetical protein J5I94_18870, partial [Phaeodactylibacter sp.]|nr:hypothetical protein [Phaeodactylibacter sp.]
DRLVSRLKSRKSEFGPEWALNAFFSAFRLPISAFDVGTSKVQYIYVGRNKKIEICRHERPSPSCRIGFHDVLSTGFVKEEHFLLAKETKRRDAPNITMKST